MKRAILLTLKLGLSILLLWYLLGKLDFEGVWGAMQKLPASVGLTIAVLLCLQVVASGERLRSLITFIKGVLDHISAIRITLIGAFFSQMFISFVGGDSVRIWLLTQRNIQMRDAAHVIVLDRTAGLLVQLMMITAALPFILPMTQDPFQRLGLLVLALVCMCGLMILFTFHRIPLRTKPGSLVRWVMDLSSNASEVFLSKGQRRLVLGYSLLINFINILVVYVTALGLGADIIFWQALVLVPAVLFLSMLPISFAGWGVREGAMIVALGLIGVPSHISLAISIIFGVSSLLISLFGSVLWLSTNKVSQKFEV